MAFPEAWDTAAILAEDEADIDDGEQDADPERDGADEAGDERAHDEGTDKAGGGIVGVFDDADAEQAFADGLASGGELPDLDAEHDQHAEADEADGSDEGNPVDLVGIGGLLRDDADDHPDGQVFE